MTLIEAVLYIAIALALIVGGLVFYQQAAFASRMNATATMVSSILAETRAAGIEPWLTESQGSWTALLIARGSIPESWLDRTKPVEEQIRHPWGGYIGWNVSENPALAGSITITVVLVDIPVQACTRLAAVSPNGKTALSDDYLLGYVVDQTNSTGPLILRNTSLALAGTRCRAADANNDGKVTLNQQFEPRN